jgi:hypothetical protein
MIYCRFKITLLILFVLGYIEGSAQQILDTPQSERIPFFIELNTLNNWYDSSNSGYTFSMQDALQSYGDPQAVPEEFYVIPGEELLDHSLLTEMLTKTALTPSNPLDSINDTTWFVYDNFSFERRAKYVCEIKLISGINIDGDFFSSGYLFRIHEMTTTWKHNDHNILDPWLYDTYYYGFFDEHFNISPLITYWSQIGISGLVYSKFIQDGSSSALSQTRKSPLILGPNPANNLLTVRITTNSQNNTRSFSVDMQDILGKVVISENGLPIEMLIGRGYQMNTAGLREGMYTLRIKNENIIYTEKVYIRH